MALSWLINLPALIQVLIFVLIWAGLWLPIAIATAIQLNWHPSQPLTPQQKLRFLASLYLLVPLIIAAWSGIQSVPLTNYGFTNPPQLGLAIAIGWVIAIVSLGLLLTVQWGLGGVGSQASTQGFTPGAILSLTGLAVWISSSEELVFRGFLQTLLQQDYTLPTAAMITSSLFALSHLLWNVEDTWPQLPGLGLMGIVLTLARFCGNDNLGLAIGLHGGWIWGFALLEKRFVATPDTRFPPWVMGRFTQPLGNLLSIILLFGVGFVLSHFHNLP